MANLSYAQLKGVWLQAAKGTRYATNAWASLMAAIAEAESGGDSTVTNPTDNNGTQTSWGLWQISLGNHQAPSPNWADPVENATLAIGKLDTQGLTAWGTYDSGAYQAYLSDKTTADLTALPGPDAASQGQLTAQAQAQANCAWGITWGGIPDTSLLRRVVSLGQSSGNIGGGQLCLLSRSQARALIAVGMMLGGAVILGLGIGFTIKAAAVAELAGLAGKLAGPAVAAGGPAPAGATAATAPAPRQGTTADNRGTSPQFRRQFLDG